MTGKEMARALAKFVNVMANGVNEEEFLCAMMQEHRTLQQNTFGLMSKLIVAWSELAEDDCCYDLRNEYTVQTCKKIVDAVECIKYRPPFI